MRRFLIASLALLAGSAIAAPAAQAEWDPYECHMFIHCTVYAPNGEPITSYEEIREEVDAIRP